MANKKSGRSGFSPLYVAPMQRTILIRRFLNLNLGLCRGGWVLDGCILRILRVAQNLPRLARLARLATVLAIGVVDVLDWNFPNVRFNSNFLILCLPIISLYGVRLLLKDIVSWNTRPFWVYHFPPRLGLGCSSLSSFF